MPRCSPHTALVLACCLLASASIASAGGNNKKECDATRTAVITGANRGIGFEAAVQLGTSNRFSVVVMTVRSDAAGREATKAATERAIKEGHSSVFFDYVVMDLEDLASVRKAVEQLPSEIDAVVLNAGTLVTASQARAPSPDVRETGKTRRVTPMFAVHVLGHAVLVEGLIAQGKIKEGARVILSGTEMSRGVWLMAGLQPTVVFEKSKMASYPAMPPTAGTFSIPVRMALAEQGNTKIFGGLWLSHLAREHPFIYFATVSPGGVGTEIYANAPQPLRFAMTSPRLHKLLVAVGGKASVEEGAARYVEAVNDDFFPDLFPTGSVVGSPSSIFPFHLGATGPLTNQNKYADYFEDVGLQREAARIVRKLAAEGEEAG